MRPITDLHHLERLIDRHMQNVEVQRRLSVQGEAAARATSLSLAEGPWMTISKQLGAGGGEVARLVAAELGWQVFDRELVQAIARETHTREKLLSKLDEQSIGLFDDAIAHWFSHDGVGPSDIVREMMAVIWALGRHGRAVLVGRGANWILDPRYGLRVRMVAPAAVRIRRLSERESLDSRAAERRVREDDAAKSAFLRQWFRRDIDDPHGYDLLLNTAAIEPPTAARIVLAALESKLPGARTVER